MAKELDVSRIIVENDLELRPYKKQKVSGLTEAQKAERVQKCRQFLVWHDIIFSNEKFFLLQETQN
jgi:hypothetical protein